MRINILLETDNERIGRIWYNKIMKTRSAKIDNLKGILIFTVVLGHLLELIMGVKWTKYIYEFIYSFHMPFFVFLSGYFYHYHFRKIVERLLCPYVVLQTIYILFSNYFLGTQQKIQYHEPYWLLWYLFAMVIWSFMGTIFTGEGPLKKFYSTQSHKKRVCFGLTMIGISLLISISCGLVKDIGRDFSLSRILVFFPFFLMGYYTQHETKYLQEIGYEQKNKIGKWILTFLTAIAVIVYVFYLQSACQTNRYSWFYEATAYTQEGYTMWFRIMHIFIAMCMIYLGMQFMPQKEVFILTMTGRRTMQVYLLHGFIIKLLAKWNGLKQLPFPKITVFIICMLMVLTLSAFGKRQERKKDE